MQFSWEAASCVGVVEVFGNSTNPHKGPKYKLNVQKDQKLLKICKKLWKIWKKSEQKSQKFLKTCKNQWKTEKVPKFFWKAQKLEILDIEVLITVKCYFSHQLLCKALISGSPIDKKSQNSAVKKLTSENFNALQQPTNLFNISCQSKLSARAVSRLLHFVASCSSHTESTLNNCY